MRIILRILLRFALLAPLYVWAQVIGFFEKWLDLFAFYPAEDFPAWDDLINAIVTEDVDAD